MFLKTGAPFGFSKSGAAFKVYARSTSLAAIPLDRLLLY
jgi:hypothetical protein